MRSDEEKTLSREAVLAKLAEMAVPYEMIEHEAAYTVEDMDRVGFAPDITICKNLFVRDQKKKPLHWLVVVPKDKRADLADLADELGTKHLSFASADRLNKYLAIAQGEVTPLAVMNDRAHAVTVVFDRDIVGHPRLGVHPNDNRATVILSYDDLLRFVKAVGAPVKTISVKG